MDKERRHNTRYNMYYTNEMSARVTTPSTAEKLQDIRQQLEEVLTTAYSKKTKRTPRRTVLSPTVNNQFGNPNNPNTTDRDSKYELSKNKLFQNDCMVPADSKILAYKKFITSLTRIIQDTNQNTPDSFSLSASLNVQNASGTQKRVIEEKGTFLIQKDTLTEPYIYGNQDIHECAEKMTYCRPVGYNQEFLSKTIEKNAKLQQLVHKLVLAREKEKQNEAWNNYINELKNKHGHYDFQTKNMPKLFEKEDEKRPIILDDSYDISHSWKQSNLSGHVFNDVYNDTDNIRKESDIRRRTWCVPSTSKRYKYGNNSFCCPMSSQGRLLMMKREIRCPGYTIRPSARYYRGSSIVVEKELPCRKKSCTVKNCGTIKSRDWTDIWECRPIQTTGSNGSNSKNSHIDVKSQCNINDACVSNIKSKSNNNQVSDVKAKFQEVSNFAEKLKNKLRLPTRDDSKKHCLVKIEHKLDHLIDTFNTFLEELKSKKMTTNVKSQAVSCSSMANNMFKTKSETYNVLTKHNILREVAQQNQHNTLAFSPCTLNQGNITEILNEEKEKSDLVKKDIDNILNSTTQCAVQITIDIPTKEHSTEVTNSFFKRQQEDTIEEEIEPTEVEELEKIENDRSMTIAVNTDPMGILALFRVSAETVKQILSYVPNLNYVTYLARRQLDNSSAVARYMCNICSASFTRPSALSDHIREHNLDNSKNCCVCRHVLDRLNHRSGLFACAHCGQMFTRAYCRELHEQTCSMADTKNGARPSLILLT